MVLHYQLHLLLLLVLEYLAVLAVLQVLAVLHYLSLLHSILHRYLHCMKSFHRSEYLQLNYFHLC